MSATTTFTSTVGGELGESEYADLERRWIDRTWAQAAGLRKVGHFDGRDLVGGKLHGDYAGIAIPYFMPGQAHEVTWRLRRENPEIDAQTQKPKNKYVGAQEDRNHIYFPPLISPEDLRDPTIPIIIVEGEFKALALRRLASDGNSPKLRFIPIAISGVWNWRGTVGKENNANGVRVPVKGVIPDFDLIAWVGRKVIIAFDADAADKAQVRRARHALSVELRSRGADVAYLKWNAEDGKGPDDWLAKVGPYVVLAAITNVEYNTASGWYAKLICTDTGKPKKIFANATIALRHAPEWNGVLRFNEFTHSTEIANKPPWGGEADRNWTDNDDRLTCEWLQTKGIDVSVSVTAEAVQTVSQESAFHPVRDYLNAVTWDGISRLGTWLSRYLGVQDSNYSRAVGERFLISAVARIMEPGCKADCCLILEGKQGAGKSTAVRILGGEWTTDDLAELGSKDASLQICGVWIIELGELDSMSKAETGRIKAFMSRDKERFRPPYGRRLIEPKRQCVFVGTVNDREYLKDETGARRFWPVACGSIDLKALKRDRDQLWAEAIAQYSEGHPWWLDTDSLTGAAQIEQEARYEGDPWEPIVETFLTLKSDTSVDEILSLCLNKERALWSQHDKTRIAKCLKYQGWKRYRSRDGEGRPWRYRRVQES